MTDFNQGTNYPPPYPNPAGGYQPYPQPSGDLPYQQPSAYQPYMTPPPPMSPPPPMMMPVQMSSSNGMAVTSLVFGILSLLFFWLTLLDLPFIILGVVFGAVGMSESRRHLPGRGMAIAGLVCSLVTLLPVIILIAVFSTATTF